MMTDKSIVQILKEEIALIESGIEHQDQANKAVKIAEIKEKKNMLLKHYHDTTYATAKTFSNYEKWIQSLGKQQKHKTGISFIDNIFGGDGIQEETFVNLVGESGAGKSTLGIQILLNVAKKEPAYFISLEMGRFKTYNKLSEMITVDDQRENLLIDIWTDNLDNILRDIELYSHNGCKFFLIDSKMKVVIGGNDPTHEKISKLSSALSKLTQKLGIIIILINQTSEEDLKNRRVSLKGSGDQLFDTDLLMSVERDKKDGDIRILNITKNRQNDLTPKVKYGLDFQQKDYEVEVTNYEMDVPYV